MIKYANYAAQIIRDECFPSHHDHTLCRLLFLNHFGTLDSESVFENPEWILQTPPIEDENLFVVNAVTQPSPDGFQWTEVHHIVARGSFRNEARFLPQRAISHDLHIAIEEGRTPNIEACRPIFHCLQPSFEWATAYANRQSAQLPPIPSEIIFKRRIFSAYHSAMGRKIKEAQTTLDSLTLKELYDYVWLLRESSWSENGQRKLQNICPTDAPPASNEWAIAMIDEINGWYTLTDNQKIYLRRLAFIAGPYGVKLMENGVPFDLIKVTSENYRTINGLYSLCIQSDNFSETARVFTDVVSDATSLSAAGIELSDIARENKHFSEPSKFYYVSDNNVVIVSVYSKEDFRRSTSSFAPIAELWEDLNEID